MFIGLIKWFDQEKKFGIIGSFSQGESFLHINNFIGSSEDLSKGVAVVFDKKFDQRNNRNTAINCRPVLTRDDYSLILKNLLVQDGITIEVEVRGKSRHDNPYRRKETVMRSVKSMAIIQLMRRIANDIIFSFVTEYFDSELDQQNFILYCEFITASILTTKSNTIAEPLLKKIYSAFEGKLNDSLLFDLWKNKKLKYIGGDHAVNDELPISILTQFMDEINLPELDRINRYDSGSQFCQTIAIQRIKLGTKDSIKDIRSLLLYLPFVPEEKEVLLKEQLQTKLVETYQKQIFETADTFGAISTLDDFIKYDRLKQIIGSDIPANKQEELREGITRLIVHRSTEEFQIQLWLKGLIKDLSLGRVQNEFLAGDVGKKLLIFKRYAVKEQIELLKSYTEQQGLEKAFSLLGEFLETENKLYYFFELSKHLFVKEFWEDKIGGELVSLFNDYVSQNTSDDDKIILFFRGYIQELPNSLMLQNATTFNKSQYDKILTRYSSDQEFTQELLFRKALIANLEELIWVVTLAKSYLGAEEFTHFDERLFRDLSGITYFQLWKSGKVAIVPEAQIVSSFQDKEEDYENLKQWVAKGMLTVESAKTLLDQKLDRSLLLSDRIVFRQQLNLVKCIVELAPLTINYFKDLKDNFYSIVLWLLGFEESFSFEFLAPKFIYFLPEEQVKIIRKLFYLKAKGKIELSLEDLNKLTRFDTDLYDIHQQYNPDIPADISTEVIINALLNYTEHKKFLVGGKLLALAIQNTGTNKKRKFKLSHYFEECRGRMVAKYDWTTNGKISKVSYEETKFYFNIQLGYDQELIAAVKHLPGRKWNPETQSWGVPSKYESEVLAFAKEYRFSLNLSGDTYLDNIHLANYTREAIPHNLTYCEGRLANKLDSRFHKEFWWCRNQKCFQKCETIHSTEQWESYTLLDFYEILQFDTDEVNRMGDFILKGEYYQFIGLINRFKQLLDKIYCEECGEILYSVDHSHFAAYAIVRFCCENAKCRLHKKEVYLNHCLNGKCNSIVDSRISKKCKNGWYICDNCGSCCSHSMLQTRLTSLQTNGGFIHPNLIRCVNEKLGHLERAEYFCHLCATEMQEISQDVFFCPDCKIKYDTTGYRMQRPHRFLPKPDAKPT